MVKTTLSTTASFLLLATTAYGVCETHSYTTCADKIVHWFDPTNGVVCDPLDCGGGMAPVKYDVPCCAAYTGTAPCVSTTSTLSCWKPSTSASSASSALASASSASTTSSDATATVTETADASVTSSSGAVTKTSSQDVSSNTTAPSTTDAPTQSTGSASSGSSSSQSISTNLAGTCVRPLMAVAGAAIGAVVMI